MDQSITLRIAGKEYSLKVQSPEMEQLMRLAAENINQMLAKYDEKFPDKTLLDKLSFDTLNETVALLSTQRKLARASEEVKALQSDIESYLDGIQDD